MDADDVALYMALHAGIGYVKGCLCIHYVDIILHVCKYEGRWFDPPCRCVLEQDTSPQIAPEGIAIGV